MASKGSTKEQTAGRPSQAPAVDRARADPQRRARRPLRRRQDHAGRGAAAGHRHDPAGRPVEDGTTVCDSDDGRGQPAALGLARASPRSSTTASRSTCSTPPATPDFVGELRAGLRAADAALFVVSAVDGVDATTIALWEECAAVGMPRAVVVTQLDHHRADFEESVAVCQRVFGDSVLPLYLPLHADDGTIGGLIGLLSRTVHRLLQRQPGRARPADPEHLELIDGRSQRADRGHHRRVRGRVPDGPLPRRRGHRHRRRSSTTWRPPSRAARSTRCSPPAAPPGSAPRPCSRC